MNALLTIGGVTIVLLLIDRLIFGTWVWHWYKPTRWQR